MNRKNRHRYAMKMSQGFPMTDQRRRMVKVMRRRGGMKLYSFNRWEFKVAIAVTPSLHSGG